MKHLIFLHPKIIKMMRLLYHSATVYQRQCFSKNKTKTTTKKKHEWKTVIEMITKIFGEMVARIGPMKNLKNVSG